MVSLVQLSIDQGRLNSKDSSATRSHQPAPQLDDTSEIQSIPAPDSSSAVSDEAPSPPPMTKGNHLRRLDLSQASTSSIDWDQRPSTPSTFMYLLYWRDFPALKVPYTQLLAQAHRLDSHTNSQLTTLPQTPTSTQSQLLLLNQTHTTSRSQPSAVLLHVQTL